MSVSQKSVVAVKSCRGYDSEQVYSSILKQFELLGGLGRFIRPSQRVLIKPNLIVPRPPQVPAQTHPEVIYAAARIVKDFGATVLVGDSPAWSNTRGCLKALGVDQRLESLGVQIVQLDQPVKMTIDAARVGISKVALEADAIINLPKLKAHQQLGATFAIKNMYGCIAGLAGKEKAYWHFARGKEKALFCRMLAEIYQKLNPVLNIIDGIVGMEGAGPIRGQPRQVGYLIAGINPVACERVCCELVGIDPVDLPLLTAACEAGLGLLDEPLDVLGDPYDIPACPGFRPAEQIPVRFSFGHICKSIGKQSGILMKEFFSR